MKTANFYSYNMPELSNKNLIQRYYITTEKIREVILLDVYNRIFKSLQKYIKEEKMINITIYTLIDNIIKSSEKIEDFETCLFFNDMKKYLNKIENESKTE